jgi:hypothetical protein
MHWVDVDKQGYRACSPHGALDRQARESRHCDGATAGAENAKRDLERGGSSREAQAGWTFGLGRNRGREAAGDFTIPTDKTRSDYVGGRGLFSRPQ